MNLALSDATALLALGISLLALYQSMRTRGGDLLIAASRERAELRELLVQLGTRASIVRQNLQALQRAIGMSSLSDDEDERYVEEQVDRLLADLDAAGSLAGPFARHKAEAALIRLNIIRAKATTFVGWVDQAEAHYEKLRTGLREIHLGSARTEDAPRRDGDGH